MSETVQECCQMLNASLECDYSEAIFAKDVYSPKIFNGPAIATLILAIISFILIVLIIRNIIDLIGRRKKLDIARSLIMNILIFLSISWRFVYFLDGPIQLFTSSDGFLPQVIVSFEIVSVGFLNGTLAYSSYTWLELILLYKRKWELPKVAISVKTFFMIDALCLTVIVFLTIVLLVLGVKNGYLLPLVPISVFSLINSTIFAITCYNMGIHLSEIYDFSARKYTKAKLLKVLAIGVAIFTLIRIVNDLSSDIFQYWQQKFNLESFCHHTITWSVYLVLISLFTDISSTLFFLIFFAAGTKQKNFESVSWGYGDSVSSQDKASIKQSLRSANSRDGESKS